MLWVLGVVAVAGDVDACPESWPPQPAPTRTATENAAKLRMCASSQVRCWRSSRRYSCRMQTLARDGVDVAYAEVGAGFPVVLHTGGAGSSSMWRRGGYVDRMPGFRLILLDHRGRGASSRPTTLADRRVSEYAADVKALIDSLGCTAYGFFGYSFGGLVGLALAASDPRLTGLVALGTVFDPPDTEPAPLAYGQAGDGGMAAVVSLIEDEEQLTLPAWARAEF